MSHHCTKEGCEAKFNRPYRLELHMLKHSGIKPFVCDEEGCDRAYSNQSHLRRHKLAVHQNIKKKKRCPVESCLRLISVENFKRHLHRQHSMDQEHMCEICDQFFHKKNHLRAHMFEHTGIAPFKCEHCPLAFISITEYKKHKKNHRKYTCSCGEDYYRWTEYLKHRREKHIEEYVCETCNKKFKHKPNYKAHLNSHNDDREIFDCPYEGCGRMYVYKKNLQQHINVFHLKVKTHPKRTPMAKPGVPRPRKVRKDKGCVKKSTALILTGLEMSHEGSKALVKGKKIEIEHSDDYFDTSDFSDMEVNIKVLKREITSSSDEGPVGKYMGHVVK